MTSSVVHERVEISGDNGRDDDDDEEEEEEGEEALPGYDEATLSAPGYDDSHENSDIITLARRCVRYRLWQCDHKAQVLEVLDQNEHDDALACPAYRITTNSRLRGLLSSWSRRKPDLEVLQTLPGARLVCMAGIWFDNDGGFPWRPRAHFEYTGDDGLTSQCQMEAERFADWRVSMGGGRTLVWRLQRSPAVALVLGERETSNHDSPVARFTFSSLGMRARKGEEVGVLEIYDGGLMGLGLGREGRDQVVCSVVVVITFFRRMGKHYNNG